MSGQVAIVTPASLCRASGDSLRPLMQARGLWAAGFRDFVLFSSQPNPALPYAQERIHPRGPAQFIFDQPRGFALIHAHQNAGLFLSGRVWADLHGFAPLESRCHWRRHPLVPRALVQLGLSHWATGRLVGRTERILCASTSIAENLARAYPRRPPLSVMRNCLDVAEFTPQPFTEEVVGVIGGFTSRWGRPAFSLALEVARACPEAPFRLVGGLSAAQRAEAACLANVEILGEVDEAGYRQFFRRVSLVLLPYALWCIGGGSRQKLLQAAAAGLSIVATPAGMEGFDSSDVAWVGQTPAELAERIRQALRDPDERMLRGQALRRHVEAFHDYLREGQRLAELYEQALRRH